MLRHRKAGMKILSTFKGLDTNAKQILTNFSSPMGFDVNIWERLRL